MKKLFSTILCFTLSFCIVLAIGCGNNSNDAAFKGNYHQVQASEITAFSESVGASNKEIDLNKGIKFEFAKTEMDGDEYEKESISFKTQVVNDSLLMAGKTLEDEKDDGREKKEETEIYYNRDTFYMNNGVKKEYVKIPFNQYLGTLTLAFGDLTLDALVAKYSNDDNVKFYMEDGKDFTKIKVEFERLDGDDKIIGKFCFRYNADKLLTGIYAELREEEPLEPNEYSDIFMSIEAYEGEIELPNDLDTYTSASIF